MAKVPNFPSLDGIVIGRYGVKFKLSIGTQRNRKIKKKKKRLSWACDKAIGHNFACILIKPQIQLVYSTSSDDIVNGTFRPWSSWHRVLEKSHFQQFLTNFKNNTTLHVLQYTYFHYTRNHKASVNAFGLYASDKTVKTHKSNLQFSLFLTSHNFGNFQPISKKYNVAHLYIYVFTVPVIKSLCQSVKAVG